MMYPSNRCHFCNSSLVKAQDGSFYYCNCENMYSVMVFNTGRFSVVFRCGYFKFNVSEHETIITDMTPGKKTYDSYRTNCPLLINNDNYLTVIEKVKSLQVFK